MHGAPTPHASLGQGTCTLSLHAPLSCGRPAEAEPATQGLGRRGDQRAGCRVLLGGEGKGWEQVRAPLATSGGPMRPTTVRLPMPRAPHLPNTPGRDGVARVSPQHGQEQEPHGPPPPPARPGLAKWQWPGRGGPGRAGAGLGAGAGAGAWALGPTRWDGDAFPLHADMPCAGLVSVSTEQSHGAPLARADSAGDQASLVPGTGGQRKRQQGRCPGLVLGWDGPAARML